jgi:hypothetical protein
MRLALVSLIALAIVSTPAQAQNPVSIFRTGNDLHTSCGTDLNDALGLLEAGLCRGYIQGAIDSYMNFLAETGQPSCLATGVTGVQVRDLVTAYLRDNPGQRHDTASNMVVRAISSLIVRCQ